MNAPARAGDGAGEDEAAGEPGGGLGRSEKRRLALLGLPTFGLALAITMVSSYLPAVARDFTPSTIVIGVLIGGEGIFALFLPVLVGTWSDRLRTRLGGRLPFVLVGVPLAAAGLALMAVAGSLAVVAVAVAVFFAGYFVAYEPYRALYPDLVREEVAGRAQSTQAVWRGAGTIAALGTGGLLLAMGQAVPFAMAATLLVAACGTFVWLAVRDGVGDEQNGSAEEPEDGRMHAILEGLRDASLRRFFVANALWELSIAALKTFVILWLTRGLGTSLAGASMVVGAVAVFVLVGAAVSGKLGDNHGRRLVMLYAAAVFGAAMVIPLVSTDRTVIAIAAPLIAFAGGVLLSLPYALLQPLMPPDRHGALTGFYSMSRGVGVMLGPLLGGLAIELGGGIFESTNGYAAVWAVCGLASLASLPLLRRIEEPERDD